MCIDFVNLPQTGISTTCMTSLQDEQIKLKHNLIHWRTLCKPFIFEWESDCCLTPNGKLSARTSYIQWNDDHVRFVLDQYADLDSYSVSSMKQLPADRYVAPLGHIVLIPNQPV
jgi:hypothetical protein